MRRFAIRTAVSVLAAALSPGCGGKDPSPPADVPAAKSASQSASRSAAQTDTPQSAIAALEAACKARDLDAVLNCFAAAPRAGLRELIDGAETEKALRDALDEKFGPEKDAPPRPAVKDTLLSLERLEVVGEIDYVTADRADVQVRETRRLSDGSTKAEDQSVSVVREAGVWKLVPPQFGTADPELVLKVARSGRANAQRVLAEVRAGKYKSRDDALAALNKKPEEVGPKP